MGVSVRGNGPGRRGQGGPGPDAAGDQALLLGIGADRREGLPFVGKYLLQRNVIKAGIPVVGVPVAVVLNRYTTLLAGRHARAAFRNEAPLVKARRPA